MQGRFSFDWKFRAAIFSLAWAVVLILHSPAVKAGDGREAAVHVVVSSGGPASSHGSGVLVGCDGSQADVLTCAHLWRGERGDARVKVGVPNIGWYEGRLLAIGNPNEDGGDVARVRIDCDRMLPCAPIGQPDEGDAGTIFGYPGASEQQARYRGQVVRLSETTLVLSTPVTNGVSGSPVFEDGAVIGIIHSTDERVCYSTPIRRALQRLGID